MPEFQELLKNPFFDTALCLLVLCLIFIFNLSRRKRDVAELQQDLDKNAADFNRLLEKYDALTLAKNQQDQAVIKAQTAAEGLQVRLTERDLQIQTLQQELEEEQSRHNADQEKMTLLRDQFNIKATQNMNLQQQVEQQQQHLQRREQDLAVLNEKFTALTRQFTALQTTLEEKEKHFTEQQHTFEQNKQQFAAEFQNLANRILEEKSQSFSQSNQTALNALLKPFREQIDGFQKRVNEIHSESVQGNAGLKTEIKRMLEVSMNMSQEANNLTAALKGEKKTLGNWGEMQLERILQLAGLEKDVHYEPQAYFKDNQGRTNFPDFVVHLPDGKHLIIDSKMSLVAYEQAVNSEDEAERQKHLQEHVRAIRHHIDELWRKDYSNLIGIRSPDFVLMFVAVEPAYIEAMKTDLGLFNYGYEKNVILVSYTTLMPILRIVSNLWRIERGNTEAREISERAGEIYNQTCLMAERLAKLGNTLSTVNGYYNSTVTALAGNQGLVGKVERFKNLSAKANKTMPQITPLHTDLEVEKLEEVRPNQANPTD